MTNTIFDQCVQNIDPAISAEVGLNIDIANRISDILQEKGITQREFARLMGKKESEISRWLTGSNGFTTRSLAKISAALGEDIIIVTTQGKAKHANSNKRTSAKNRLRLSQ